MAIKTECLLSPPPPSPLAPIKIQNGDIMVPTNPVPPGKWPFRMEREGEGQRKMTGLLCITSCHTITLFMIPFLAIMHKMMKSLPTQFLQNARPFAFLFHPTYLVTAKHISVSSIYFQTFYFHSTYPFHYLSSHTDSPYSLPSKIKLSAYSCSQGKPHSSSVIT